MSVEKDRLGVADEAGDIHLISKGSAPDVHIIEKTRQVGAVFFHGGWTFARFRGAVTAEVGEYDAIA